MGDYKIIHSSMFQEMKASINDLEALKVNVQKQGSELKTLRVDNFKLKNSQELFEREHDNLLERIRRLEKEKSAILDKKFDLLIDWDSINLDPLLKILKKNREEFDESFDLAATENTEKRQNQRRSVILNPSKLEKINFTPFKQAFNKLSKVKEASKLSKSSSKKFIRKRNSVKLNHFNAMNLIPKLVKQSSHQSIKSILLDGITQSSTDLKIENLVQKIHGFYRLTNPTIRKIELKIFKIEEEEEEKYTKTKVALGSISIFLKIKSIANRVRKRVLESTEEYVESLSLTEECKQWNEEIINNKSMEEVEILDIFHRTINLLISKFKSGKHNKIITKPLFVFILQILKSDSINYKKRFRSIISFFLKNKLEGMKCQHDILTANKLELIRNFMWLERRWKPEFLDFYVEVEIKLRKQFKMIPNKNPYSFNRYSELYEVLLSQENCSLNAENRASLLSMMVRNIFISKNLTKRKYKSLLINKNRFTKYHFSL